ncbi:MAG TPA: hypothetical protein VMZ27_13410 [Candidatus Saccharimonadales bacterium]|nr:hypothetical protein [Candidatus Saccharimonadales bacterium]
MSAGDNSAGGYAFDGYLDEVRLWSVARPASSIVAGMTNEIRSGTGLLATFGSGGDQNDIRSENGTSTGTPAVDRESGFGIHPRTLCIPHTGNGLVVNGVIDMLNEYRGAETIVLRSTNLLSNLPDQPAYLIFSINSTNNHLYIGVPNMPQAGSPQIPYVHVMCDLDPIKINAPDIGDWQCTFTQDSFQGGYRYDVNPPFFPTPQWLSWGQSTSNWQGATSSPFEFIQNYEFRIHARHLNYFTNSVGLLVQYAGYSSGGDFQSAPITGITNQSTSYAQANWCGFADSNLRPVSLSGVVSNVTIMAGEFGWNVSLSSGANPLTATQIRTVPVNANGSFTISGYLPEELPFHVTLDSRTGYTYLPPEFVGAGILPANISENRILTFPACVDGFCATKFTRFRVQSPPGPVGITGMTPSSGSPELVLRASPLKVIPATIVTLTGSNLHTLMEVSLSKCPFSPPSFCTEGSDIFRCTILSNDFARNTLTVQLPGEDPQFVGSMQWVLKDLDPGHPGWTQWVYGPSGFVVNRTHPYPVLNGFEFINRDDGPSVEEFEACYGDSIFNFVRIREPYYAIWAAVYFGWMDGTHGSCYGMAGTSRLFADGILPIGTFDVADGDGVRGVRFASGYLGDPVCDIPDNICPPKPGRWTGFDLFQPFRPKNVWARITSMAGAQTSSEALASWLSQLHRPAIFGPRRGLAGGEPLAVLNRVRAAPNGYTICVQKMDFGDGHCITPYGVVDGMGLDVDALTPIVAADFSLIKVYDNNHPDKERFIEVNRATDTFRYHSGIQVGIYTGPGMFSVPMSIYRNERHAPDPFFLGRYGVDFLRLLTTGAAASTFADSTGGLAGWTASGLTNTYEGALPFIPFGAVVGSSNNFSTTMFFLPASNAPVGGSFVSGGSNILVYGGMGWGDIAFGFNAPNTSQSNSVDGILIGLDDGLRGLGFHAGAAVTGFGAMVSSRTSNGASRVFLIDAGSGPINPDIALERDAMKTLTIRNRSAASFTFRLNLAGTDLALGSFEYAYAVFNQPGKSTLTLRIPSSGADRSLIRELDTNNDGIPDQVEAVPANGQLRGSREAGLLALRWRQLSSRETVECASNISAAAWSPVSAAVTNEGPDQVVRVATPGSAQFYRLKASATNCFSFAAFSLGPRPNPWNTNGLKFEAFSAVGTMLPQNTIVNRGGFVGLDVAHTMRILPQDDCHVIEIDVMQTSGLVSFEAVGSLGVVVGRATLTGPGTGLQRVTLRGFRDRIQFVRVVSPNALCAIINVCCERTEQPPAGTPFSICVDIANATPGTFPSPYGVEWATFASKDDLIIGPVSGLSGNWLKLIGSIDVALLPPGAPCDHFTLRVRDLEGVVKANAYNSVGDLVASAGPPPGNLAPQEMVLNGSGITRVVITSTSDKAFLQSICCERAVGE